MLWSLPIYEALTLCAGTSGVSEEESDTNFGLEEQHNQVLLDRLRLGRKAAADER